MKKNELKVGMWVKYIYGGNWIRRVLALGLGKEGDIAEVGDKNNTYCYDDLEPATREEIAKELGWELAKEFAAMEVDKIYFADYEDNKNEHHKRILEILAEIESGVKDE